MKTTIILVLFHLFSLLAFAQPAVSDFTPKVASVGDLITITGSDFNATPALNRVFIGEVEAQVVSGDATSLTVQVPSGVNHAFITVADLTTGMMAYSGAKLTINFLYCRPVFAGMFASPVVHLAPSNSTTIGLADIDGDGKQDLMTCDPSGDKFHIALNESEPGMISYTNSYSRTQQSSCWDPKAGDFNGDGKLDVVFYNNETDSIMVLVNSSTPGVISFSQTLRRATLPGSSPIDIALTDLDLDGKVDIVLTHACTPEIVVFKNISHNGSVGFLRLTLTVFQSGHIDVGDLNGDSKPEIVVTSGNSNTVKVFRNTSSVGSISFSHGLELAAAPHPFDISVGDLNNDGLLDIVSLNRNDWGSPGSISVFRNLGGAGLNFAPAVNAQGGLDPYSVQIDDLDGDGRLDVVAGNYGSNATLSVYRNIGESGAITFQAHVPITANPYPFNIETADIDGDGRIDIVASSGGGSGAATYRSVGCDGVDNVSACNSMTWIDGVTYTNDSETTSYTYTNTSIGDSTVYLHLSLGATSYGVDAQSACGSYTWIDGNTYYSDNHTASHTLTNASGCDSIVTLNLTVLQPQSNTEILTVCGSHTWNGQTYMQSGSYIGHFLAANGCDSTVTLNLTVNHPVTSEDFATACESFVWNGQEYNASGVYTETFSGANGCDSTATLNLVIHHSGSGSETVTACESYTWNGNTYTESGNYSFATSTVNGCDSVANLTLTIHHPDSGTETITACGSYSWNGENYSSSGTYNRILTSTTGCDSLAVLNLTINQPVTHSLSEIVCDYLEWTGQTYTESGTYTQTFSSSMGCDSIVTLSLTVNHGSFFQENVNVCGSYTWSNGQTYTESTSDFQYFTGVNGCDSTIMLTLNVFPLPVAEITQNTDGSLSAPAGTYFYQWINCTTNGGVGNNQHFSPGANGSYAVVISNLYGCVDTSSCFLINNVGISEGGWESVVISPNPASDQVKIQFPGEQAELKVYDAAGKIVFESRVKSGATVPVASLQSGVYFFGLQTDNGRSMHEFVKM